MNIFILHRDPRKAAQMHCDKHLIKMITETAQLLTFAHLHSNPDMKGLMKVNVGHMKHPCTLWLIEDKRNYLWTYQLLNELLQEYDYRYDGLKNGKYSNIVRMMDNLRWIPESIPGPLEGEPEHFVLAMKHRPECITDDPIESYRRYYLIDKARFAKWAHARKQPRWYNQGKRQLKTTGDITKVTLV